MSRKVFKLFGSIWSGRYSLCVSASIEFGEEVCANVWTGVQKGARKNAKRDSSLRNLSRPGKPLISSQVGRRGKNVRKKSRVACPHRRVAGMMKSFLCPRGPNREARKFRKG